MNKLLSTCLFSLIILSACKDFTNRVEPDHVRYEVIFRESNAGEYIKKRKGSNDYSCFYSYTDRGRGPNYKEEIILNDQNYISKQVISGVNYLKDSIYEQFSIEGKTATFINPGGNGDKNLEGKQLYFRYDGSPFIYELLGKLLLRASDNKIELFPKGSAKLNNHFSFDLQEGNSVKLLAISGLDMNPEYIWVDGDNNMVARISGNLHVIREDLLTSRSEMKAIQDSLENEYLFEKSQQLTHEHPIILIKDVNVFTAQGKLLKNQDVLVEGQLINAIKPTGQQKIPPQTHVLEGSGKTLMPGMFDMHTHNSKFRGALHIAGGVTSVRDLANNKQLEKLKEQFEKNDIIGPRIIYLCGIIDGPGPYANKRNVINNLEEGLAEIEEYHKLDYDQIKLYSSILPEWVEPLANKSHQLGMKVSGHIPAFMTASQAIDRGFDEIQHINMFFLNFLPDTIDTRTPLRFTMVAKHGYDLDLSSQNYQSFVQKLKSKNIIIDPTVSIFENMFIAKKGEPSPTYQKIIDRLPLMNQRRFLSGGLPKPSGKEEDYYNSYKKMLDVIFDLYEKGIAIVPGTDGLPGFLYHRELELYHQSGIPTTEVLKMATIKSAQIAGVSNSLGSIEAGKMADLILIDGNPLKNISDIRRIEWTIKGGQLFYAKELYASMGITHFK